MFCKKCGSLILSSLSECLFCKSKILITKTEQAQGEIKVSNDSSIERGEERIQPITYEECSECGNQKAFYTMTQNRSSDEPETIFLER